MNIYNNIDCFVENRHTLLALNRLRPLGAIVQAVSLLFFTLNLTGRSEIIHINDEKEPNKYTS